MKFRDEYRGRELVQGMAERIGRLAERVPRPMTFMEVCGTHTMAIYRYGLKSLLPQRIRLVSGPGCPVCVTPTVYIDRAIAYCRLPETIVATYGDMMRVPGTSSSLMAERASGARVQIVRSSLDAVAMAVENPDKRVIFLGIGFETTAPTAAASILAAEEKQMRNYFVLSAHKTIPIAMEILSADPETAVDGYLCPSHVSAVIGGAAYRSIAELHGVPCVITGFEPADIMQGVEMLVRQVVEGKNLVENQYRRAVRWDGNPKAREIMARVFAPCDTSWRGMGVIPGSGLAIADSYASFDAERAMPVAVEAQRENPGCRCGEVLRGKISPGDCRLFGAGCTPDAPLGACMVSSEGSCAAAFKYGR